MQLAEDELRGSLTLHRGKAGRFAFPCLLRFVLEPNTSTLITHARANVHLHGSRAWPWAVPSGSDV